MSTEGLSLVANIVPHCPQCGKQIEIPVARKIIDRGYDPVRRKQYVRERILTFCCGKCGGDYQMGCEG